MVDLGVQVDVSREENVPSSICLQLSNTCWKVINGTIFTVLNVPAVLAMSSCINCPLLHPQPKEMCVLV